MASGEFGGAGGLPDLLSSVTVGGGGIRLDRNTGAGFVFAASQAIATAGAYFTGAADMSGDGNVDAIHSGPAGVTVVLGNGNAAFTNVLAAVGAGPAAPFTVADLDGTAQTDLAQASNTTTGITVYTNTAGTLTATPASPLVVGSNPTAIASGQVDAGSVTDLVTTVNSTGQVALLLGLGGATYAAPTLFPTGGTNPVAIVVADFNADGRADVATANRGSDNISVLLGDGAGGFGSPIATALAPGAQPVAMGTADFNADGKADLVVVTPGTAPSQGVTVLLAR